MQLDHLNVLAAFLTRDTQAFRGLRKAVRVLEDWCPPFPDYFLYYPSRRQQSAALSALIDTLRLENRRK